MKPYESAFDSNFCPKTSRTSNYVNSSREVCRMRGGASRTGANHRLHPVSMMQDGCKNTNIGESRGYSYPHETRGESFGIAPGSAGHGVGTSW